MDYEPLSGRVLPRFSGIKTFFRLPHVPVDADYELAIVGVPFDGGVSYRPGARFAPSRIREVSSLGRAYNLGRAENFVQMIKVADVGDCPTVPIDLLQTYEKIETYFTHLMSLKKKFIAVGGDHSTTLPLLRAVRKAIGQPLILIHFDAHLDTYPAAWNCEYHHGAFARHAVEEGLIVPHLSHQIGIRGPLAGKDDLDFVKLHKINVHTVDAIREQGIFSFVKTLPDFGDSPVYISFDIDCLDPAYAPGTGTPVVGGLTTYETQKILRSLQIKNLIAADIVEVSPPYDQSDITSLAALDTLFEFVGLFAQQN
jgi:guanidinopropionase